MSTIAANYRSFSSCRGRRPRPRSGCSDASLGAAIGLFIAFGIVIPLLPEPPVTQPLAPDGTGANRRIHPRAAQTSLPSRGTEADRGAEGADASG